MSGQLILVIEDEPDISELLEYNLTAQRYRVICTESGETGLDLASRERPDLILLDLMLPGIDGLEVCRRLREKDETASIPIIMVTARGEESDVVTGLELGADDYITKPFSPKVLIARARAVLRSSRSTPVDAEKPIRVHGIEIHPGRHEVKVEGNSVELTNTEFKILNLLARRPGWVFTRYQVVDGIRGENYPVTERSVDVQIVSLRRKLGEKRDVIETVRGVGYRFKE